jgi:membrane protease YdiL (CAAX protease family)
MNVAEIIRELTRSISPGDVILCLPGLLIFTVWLNRTSLGRFALVDSPVRGNSMPAYLPLIPMLVWYGTLGMAISLRKSILTDVTEWEASFIDHILICICTGIGIVLIVILARWFFARRLKGFGLSTKNWLKDFAIAVVNLITIYPFVTIALLATLFFCKLFIGPAFKMPEHQELILLGKQSPTSVKVLISVITIIVIPIFEEMLFRGMFQTALRSYLSELQLRQGNSGKQKMIWAAIAITSVFFAATHGDKEHWPALFVLAMCLGYSYEKSGSLLRPIFIHAMFNANSVIFTLYST